MRNSNKFYDFFIYIFALFNFLIGMSAVIGGYKIITTNGLGMPLSWIENSPFTSYFWPAIILIVFVGGPYLMSVLLLLRKTRWASYSCAIAGFGLLIWIFVELYIMQHSYWLHALYFGFGISTLIGTMFLIKSQKNMI